MQRKKAVYIMTFSQLFGQVSDILQKDHNIDPALYVGLDLPHLKDTAIGRAPFYDVNDARRARSPDHIKGYKKTNLDPVLIESFAGQQAILSEMSSRFLLGKKAGNFHQRRHYLWELYRIWCGLFDSLEPDMVIAGSMPHRVFDYLAYTICENRNIQYFAMETTSIQNMVYACTSVHDQSKSFAAENFKDRGLKPLSEPTREFYNYVKKASEDYRPFNVSLSGLFKTHKVEEKKDLKKKLFEKLPWPLQIAAYAGKLILTGRSQDNMETILDFYPDEIFKPQPARQAKKLKYLGLTARANIAVRRAEKYYNAHLSEVDDTKPYIYFPANFMPERSTVPDSGYFYDYFLIFSMLNRALPENWEIVFKEHPRSFYKPIAADNPRDIDFYLRLREGCPRIKFIPQTTDSKKLIRHCKAIAIASGTTGWEAIARGKPVLLFGEYWYGRCDGVFRIHGLEDLHKAVGCIQENPVVLEENVIEYLRRVETVSEDLGYYFTDNVDERAWFSKDKPRTFTNEELEFRRKFSRKMADYIIRNTA